MSKVNIFLKTQRKNVKGVHWTCMLLAERSIHSLTIVLFLTFFALLAKERIVPENFGGRALQTPGPHFESTVQQIIIFLFVGLSFFSFVLYSSSNHTPAVSFNR